MKFAIPSYNRPEKLKKTTLAYLFSENIEAEDIYVFLKDEEQLALYKRSIDENLNWIVCNTTNLKDKRQFIIDFFPDKEIIVSLDDDIKRLKMLEPRSLKCLLAELFTALVENNCSIWGIYPVNNLFYCKERVKIGKQFICSNFYGFINNKSVKYTINAGCKLDIWLSCYLSEKEQRLLRYEGACPDTTYFAKGGLSDFRTFEQEVSACNQIVKEYPHLVSYAVKKDGHPYCVWKKQNLIIQPLRRISDL